MKENVLYSIKCEKCRKVDRLVEYWERLAEIVTVEGESMLEGVKREMRIIRCGNTSVRPMGVRKEKRFSL